MNDSENTKQEAIFTIGDVAKELSVASHVVNHYSKNLSDLLGEDMQIDPSNGYRKYTPNGLRKMKIIRRMVQDERKTLEQVREELDKDHKENVNLPTRLEMDMAQSYEKITRDIATIEEKTTAMFKAMGLLTEKLGNLDTLPNVIKAYQDEVTRVNREQQENINELQLKLSSAENEKESLRSEVQEMKEEIEAMKSGFQSELQNAAEHILSEGEKRWASPKLPEKKEKKGIFGFLKR